jgi:hypothetical protein
MRCPRIRFTLRQSLMAVALLAMLLAATRAILVRLGPRNGHYLGTYRYLGPDWKWHVVRGNVIFVKDRLIIVD